MALIQTEVDCIKTNIITLIQTQVQVIHVDTSP